MPRRYHTLELKSDPRSQEKFNEGAISSYSLVGRLSPSGKLTVGRVPLKKMLQSDAEYERARGRYQHFQRRHWDYQQGLVIESGIRTIQSPQLGLSSVSNCHNEISARRHGLKGISQNGRKVVRESCYILEQRYKKGLGFYTLTCPYTDLESIYSYNKNIAHIQRSYFQELKRHYERMGVIWSYVSVLEIQGKRYARDGVPVLHVHYVAPCYLPGTTKWILEASQIRLLWAKVLSNCLGGSPASGASVDASVIEKSASGYISKYLSKGGTLLSFISEICPDQLPSQWWSTSRNVRACVKANTVDLPLAVCQSFVGGSFGDCIHPDDLLYLREIWVQWNAEMICVGISADIDDRSAWGLRPFSEWQLIYEEL